MKKFYWLFISVLIISVLLVEYDLARRSQGQTNKNIAFQKKNSISGKIQPQVIKKNEEITSKSSFDSRFNQAADEISQLQIHPEETEKKLQDLAGEMSSEDVKKIAQVMTNPNINGDQRSMAVEILSRHQTVESLKQLEDFILQHDETTKWSRSREFESVLRAQAIEGIAAFPQKDLALSSLMALDPKLDEAFLKDRIQRSMAGLRSENQSSEKQDNEALSKLVE